MLQFYVITLLSIVIAMSYKSITSEGIIMTASSVTIRIDSDTKREVSRIANHFGFDLSSITRAFYKQIIRENRIPLDLSDPQPNRESLESIEAADRIISDSNARFSSADAMIASLKA